MPEMIFLSTEDAEFLVKQTLADWSHSNPFVIEPVLVEGGPHTGKWAVPARCVDHPAFQKHSDILNGSQKNNVIPAIAFPPKSQAEENAWQDPWKSAKEEAIKDKEENE